MKNGMNSVTWLMNLTCNIANCLLSVCSDDLRIALDSLLGSGRVPIARVVFCVCVTSMKMDVELIYLWLFHCLISVDFSQHLKSFNGKTQFNICMLFTSWDFKNLLKKTVWDNTSSLCWWSLNVFLAVSCCLC